MEIDALPTNVQLLPSADAHPLKVLPLSPRSGGRVPVETMLDTDAVGGQGR
jgi:hypothetical protein